MSKELIKQGESNDFNVFLQTLIDSKKLPIHIKTVQDAFTVAQMGKELGFQTMTAFHYIIPIQGRLTLSAKAIGGLIRKGGVEYTTEEDAVYVYSNGMVSDYYVIPPEGVTYIDRRTTIRFYRNSKEEKCSYTWSDADAQGLTSKDNWKRMPREMLFARCLSKGANRIASDLLLGLYTTEEMVDALNISESSVKRNEDGMVEEIIEVQYDNKI